MKILITGGSGLLGQYLNIELSKENEILSLYGSNPRNCNEFNSAQADINDRKKLEKIFEDFLPNVVVHTAAYSNPMHSRTVSSKDFYLTNVTATKNIAELCEKNKAKLIYTSTDLVYAGYRGTMLKEDAKLIPVSMYAETKLMGEVKIQETFDDFIILRTALLYGFGLHESKCHFHEMYKNLKTGKNVNLFRDQFRTPLSLKDAARIISALIKKDISGEIINFGGRERVSRLELGELLCEAAGINKSLLISVPMDSLPDLPQVADVSLNTEKLQSFGIKQKNIEESIQDILIMV